MYTHGHVAPSSTRAVQTAAIAALLCPLWFGLNYTFNFSLSRTSLASNTILSSTSSLWTLVLSVLVLKQRLVWPNVVGVLGT